MLRRVLWTIAALALALLLVEAFVADVYAVASGSMRPTLFGGEGPRGGEERELVLVRHDRSPRLERFDLVVANLGDGSAPLVKRVAGLPGEAVALRGGDLWIDGRRLPPAAPRPAPIPVFDDRQHGAPGFFDFGLEPEGPWRREEGAWRVDARAVAPGEERGMMQLRRGLHDDYLDQAGVPVRGARPVNDALLEGEASFEPPERGDALLRLALTEGVDTFVAELRPEGPLELAVTLSRYNPRTLARAHAGDKREVLGEARAFLGAGAWFSFRFANVDDCLSLELDGERLLTVPGIENEEAPTSVVGTSARGARVAFGAAGLVARFRAIRVLRDLYYTDAGSHAVDAPAQLGLDEYFLLGDNSASSTDSRTFGPVAAEHLVGRPVAVVWPPGRLRRLAGARGPAEP